ncbi:MAG: HAD family phosphatase [Eubacteriales bacterium]|jgi:HAD superfamily hydrolase (TIGR01509 family)|nr:HAD family phosphatase [Eubacteriales bacterium]MDD4104976.1 HAD family phosphatase [Eubacteriales bacterium]MDD4711078.1 HAD family phosphatase [Eubacteriales bacterium]NLO15721.1 HAD family phosphatase [Clostridiales bacterium]
MLFDAVIFDMDGLLLDTEKLGLQASIYAGREQGLSIDVDVVILTLGVRRENDDAIYRKHYPDFDSQRFWHNYDEWFLNYTTAQAPGVKPYARELLCELSDRSVKTGLCSSTHETRVHQFLKQTGLCGAFDALVTGSDGAASKPAPDMYLLAAKKLCVSPHKCLVLEDSPNGLRAGHAAGMRTYMVPDLVPYSEEFASFCDGVLFDLSHVLPLLGNN